MKALLSFDGVDKRFGPRLVLQGLNLRLGRGQVMGVLGPSGVGKSTLLRLAAGLERPDRGRVLVRARRLSYVFQEPRLLPWFSALDNVALAARARGAPWRRARAEAAGLLQDLRLGGELKAMPHELSGGMRQRVSLARAMVVNPDLLLLDEPFTGLDIELGGEVRIWVESKVKETGCAVLHVTHDAGELFSRTSALFHIRGPREHDLRRDTGSSCPAGPGCRAPSRRTCRP